MKKLLSFALALVVILAFAAPAMAANGDGDITTNLVKQSDGTALLTVTYTSGNNSIKAATFELVGTGYKSGVVPFDKKSGTYTFVLDKDVPAGVVIRMTEDKGNKPVVVNGAFAEGFHIHRYSTIITPPNCTEKGYTTYTCGCGESYAADYVNELGHSYSKIIVPMTPESDGYTMNLCTRKGCGHSFESDHVDCKPYDWQVVETVAPTCTEQGYTIYEDHYWNVEKTDDYVPALDHKYESVVTDPTCTEGGYTTHTCQREGCGASYIDDEKDALGHNWVAGDVTAPTCTVQGHTAYTCDRDGCGESKDDDFEAALGHDLSEVLNNEATCLEDGHVDYAECSRCDYTEGETIPALGHDMSEALNEEATCLEVGYAGYSECSRCDYTEGEILVALGHDLSEVLNNEATCLEDGHVDYAECSRCDYTEGEILDALGHDMSEALNLDATCLDVGYAEYSECSRCDHTEGEILKALGHNWEVKSAENYTSPTRAADGYWTLACKRDGCDETKIVQDEGSKVVLDTTRTPVAAVVTVSGSGGNRIFRIDVTEYYTDGSTDIHSSNIFSASTLSNGVNNVKVYFNGIHTFTVVANRQGNEVTIPNPPTVTPASTTLLFDDDANADDFTLDVISIIRVV